MPCADSMEAQYALSRAEGLSQVVRERVISGNYFLLSTSRERYIQQAMRVRRMRGLQNCIVGTERNGSKLFKMHQVLG